MPSEFEQAVSRFRRHSAALSALDRLKIRPWHWLTAVVLALGADLITPPSFYFRPLFLIGVLLAAWGSGRAAGVALAVSMPLANLAAELLFWGVPLSSTVCVNVLTESIVFSLLAFMTAYAAEIRILRGMLPICSYCKKIRESDAGWESIERYVEKRAEVLFSHGICPECAAIHFPEIMRPT